MMMMTAVKLISVTPDSENIIAYCARVSSPQQDNPNIAGLLKYMIREGHWSPFEMANMVVEITTSRAIAQQILRHRSFSFQEFSQRYSAVDPNDYLLYYARRQDEKNRQNSIDDMSGEDVMWFQSAQHEVAEKAFSLYREAISKGIAKETARFLLPLNTKTKLYMNGTLRSWIHYIQLRSPEHGTQKEHSDIVAQIKEIFIEQFPTISEALEWNN
jgi:thymidylate synthase (FAD)